VVPNGTCLTKSNLINHMIEQACVDSSSLLRTSRYNYITYHNGRTGENFVRDIVSHKSYSVLMRATIGPAYKLCTESSFVAS
jgi:hypothetical protein